MKISDGDIRQEENITKYWDREEWMREGKEISKIFSLFFNRLHKYMVKSSAVF